MTGDGDGERRGEYTILESAEGEDHALLPSTTADLPGQEQPAQPSSCLSSYASWVEKRRYSMIHLGVAFVCGMLASSTIQSIFNPCRASSECGTNGGVHSAVSTHVGNGEWHNFPPESPTNAFPSYFPTDVGYAGHTPTGAEPALVKTAPAYPIHTGAPVLLPPTSKDETEGAGRKKFDMLKYWGNLSPWYSVEKGAFGIDSGPDPPDGCAVTGLHFLHRHGARYPTGICA
jgi:hypothetical protein